jgi:pimeloyl-ACP methyl ester carboxylesterase
MKRREAFRTRKRLRIALITIAVLFAGCLSFFAFLVFKIKYPSPLPEDTKPSHYLLASKDVSWSSSTGRDVKGWWTEGLAGQPAVLLAPGYDLSRSDALSLAAELGKRGFHSLIYAAGGHSGDDPSSSCFLGVRATDDMILALDFLESRNGVEPGRVGVWGVDIGARAALEVAIRRPEVKVIVADSPYDAVADFLRLNVINQLGYTNRLIEFGCQQLLGLFEWVSPASLNDRLPLEGLADRSVLFLGGDNRRDMALLTEGIYARLRPEKQLLLLTSSRVRLMSAEMLAVYDGKVGDFFSVNLGAARSLTVKQTGRVNDDKDE